MLWSFIHQSVYKKYIQITFANKKDFMIAFFTALLFCILCSCAFAPLSDPITPQTLGKGNQSHNITAGYPYVGYVYNYGVSESLDLGLQFESQIKGFAMGARLILEANEYEEGQWNGALLAGAGLTTEGSYVYGGMIWGRKWGFYELALTPRINFTNISREIDADVTADFADYYSLELREQGNYFYTSLSLANTFWFRPTFGFSIIISGAYVLPWVGSTDSGFLAPYGGIGLTFK